jgi:hypothetical protein
MSTGQSTPPAAAPAPVAKPGIMARLIADLQTGAATVDAELLKLWNSLPSESRALLTAMLPMIEQAIQGMVVTLLATQGAGSATGMAVADAVKLAQSTLSQVETAMAAPVAAVTKTP